MKTKIFTFIVLAAIVVAVIAIWRTSGEEASADAVNLAACLASKNITMYGRIGVRIAKMKRRRLAQRLSWCPT